MADVRVSRLATAVFAVLLAGAVPACARRSAAVAPAAPTASVPAPSTSSPTATSASASTSTSAATSTSTAAVTAAAAPPATALPSGKFADIHAGLETASSDDCLGCHAEALPRSATHGSHPIGMDLAAVGTSSPGRYRALADIRTAGIALPDGKVACVTCHDLRSPWKDRIALPKGAVPRRAVVLGDPSTYGDDTGSEAAEAAPGEAVSAKPLCQACHAF